MKLGRLQLYILISIVLVILLRTLTELRRMRTFARGGEMHILYQITQIEPKCNYSSGMIYFQIPECHQTRVGETYMLSGTLGDASDKDDFSKKRLIIKEKVLFSSNICSLFAWKNCFLQWRSQLWSHITQPILENMPAPHSGLLLSMIFGAKDELDLETSELFRTTGTSHIQAVSGYNFVVIAAGVTSATNHYLRKRAQGTVILACTLMFFYIVGTQPSVIRAVLTLITVLASKFFLMRQYNSQFSMALVLVIMSLLNPIWLFSISFQLSALAVAGILYIQPLLLHWIDRICLRCTHRSVCSVHANTLLSEFTTSFTTSLAAAIATAPLLLFYFHELPVTGIFISTVLSSLLNFIVTVGFWTTLTAAICYSWAIKSVCAIWIKSVLYVPLEVFLSSMQAVNQIHFLTIHVTAFPWWAVVLCYFAVLLWVKIENTPTSKPDERVFA